MTPAIRIDGLAKSYRLGERAHHGTLGERLAALLRRPRGQARQAGPDEIWALKDVSFEVQPGEVVGIIGRNGAGKSTLLKILSRITEPTRGAVEMTGRVSSLLEVGTGFHPELTGRENVYLNGSILGMRKAEIDRKFDRIVDFAGVERFLDTPVKRYSSGMQVRLAFAVAAHLEPEILIVDEVLAVGDAEFQRKCLGKMGEVAGGGRTVLFVSHNMAAVERLCSRAVCLEGGKLHLSGSTKDVVQRYMSLTASENIHLKQGSHIRSMSVAGVAEDGSYTAAIKVSQKFAFSIEFTTPRVTSAPHIGLVLRQSPFGEAVFGINTAMLGGIDLSSGADCFRVRFSFRDLPIVQGAYTFDVSLWMESTRYELAERCFSFSVLESSPFPNGGPPQAHAGPIFTVPGFEVWPLGEMA